MDDVITTLQREVRELKDHQAILSLANAFADAANRVDAALFASVWRPDAHWKIGPPIDKSFEGREAIVGAFEHLLASWDFFVQLSTSYRITLRGDEATASFYVNEIARSNEGRGNYNLAQYRDELVKVDGQWYFQHRSYRVIYLDESPMVGKSFAL